MQSWSQTKDCSTRQGLKIPDRDREARSLKSLLEFTYDAFISEGDRSISDEPDGPEDVRDNQGLEDVELEVAVGAANGDSDVIAHHLSGDHRDGFALSWVDFAWTCK